DVADLGCDVDRLGGFGERLHRLAGVEIRVDVGDPPRVALRQHQHGDGLAVTLRHAAHGVFRAGTVLHAEGADGFSRGDAGNRIRHVYPDALLAHHDGADVCVGGVLDQMVDRVAAEDLDPLALHDFRDCRAELHGRFSPEEPADCPTRPSPSWNRNSAAGKAWPGAFRGSPDMRAPPCRGQNAVPRGYLINRSLSPSLHGPLTLRALDSSRGAD